MKSTSRVTSKGQVTIPQEIRERLGIFPSSEVSFVVKGRSVHLVKSKIKRGVGRKIVESVAGTATRKWSTDELMKLLRG